VNHRDRSVSALIADHRWGHALASEFYKRDDIFELDIALLQDRWTCVGHASEVSSPGDWTTAELGAESVIVARGDDGALRALANVCRHRGSRVCVEARGTARVLVCPYHAWSYGLDGLLRQARNMPAGFDPAAHALKALPLKEIGGLIFISFGDHPPDFERAGEGLGRMTDHYGWAKARVAERRSYSVAANWKLVLENYHECYHCAPAHPEFSRLHALARPSERRLRLDIDPATGWSDLEAWDAAPDGAEVARVMRSALSAECETGSEDGRRLAPLMAPGLSGDCVFAELGFLSAFLAYADYGLIYRFIPRGVMTTDMEVTWLVHPDAKAGRDYDPARLTWLWDVTSLADKRIIETNQAGVLSRHYAPGPFSLMEPGALAYVDRYLGELSLMARGAHGI